MKKLTSAAVAGLLVFGLFVFLPSKSCARDTWPFIVGTWAADQLLNQGRITRGLIDLTGNVVTLGRWKPHGEPSGPHPTARPRGHRAKDLYDNGYKSGYDKGYWEGKKKRYEDEYGRGYERGLEDGYEHGYN
jgi:hypothetical protein